VAQVADREHELIDGCLSGAVGAGWAGRERPTSPDCAADTPGGDASPAADPDLARVPTSSPAPASRTTMNSDSNNAGLPYPVVSAKPS
jgi:hypothetical protein